MIPAVPAAYIAPVGYVLSNQPQRCTIFAQYPFDAKIPDLFLECQDRKFELALIQRDRDQLVSKWRTLLICYKRVEKRQAILASGHADGDAVAGTQHGKPSHGAPHRVEDLLAGIDHYKL